MRPYFGPYVDGPDRPPPEIVERTNVAHPTFGFLLEGTPIYPGTLNDKMEFLSARAREAYLWLLNQAIGPVRIVPSASTGRVYVDVQIQNEQDAVLFKTFWI